MLNANDKMAIRVGDAKSFMYVVQAYSLRTKLAFDLAKEVCEAYRQGYQDGKEAVK